MNWEVFRILIKWWIMKSIMEREEMKARSWSWIGRKWKDQWNEWTSWQCWRIVVFKTNMEVEVRGLVARLYYLTRQSNSWWWGFRYDQSWIGAEIKGSGMKKSRNRESRSWMIYPVRCLGLPQISPLQDPCPGLQPASFPTFRGPVFTLQLKPQIIKGNDIALNQKTEWGS